ncbi:peptidoglycan/LPS O-acetylase OafA/YrhL [Paenibacillus phyllosphaerae]|uniref:Peptidoglycan/LPS O-acetylase OafA/YrhL n=1 Tax=Paenibacillus phyllosphaerae TaxID=274593 RepID=A0A7W5FL06_9BACL|nr:acyltransferase [Paenibacillus phyllosphaerae]MBB3108539.1 peptidoglycan/LPS O-acetylase OafA/YrhL [Paenibacillus phyllosphaerae]
MKVKERDVRVDILRFIAIVGIILAHSEPFGALFQLRNFDVVLMVLLLGTSFYLSNHNKKAVQFGDYLVKRFNRLVVPTWQFLFMFFVLFWLISLINGDSYYFKIWNIVDSFALMNDDGSSSIGYVWIMKVFFVIAVISPFLLKLSQVIKNNFVYLLLLSAVYAIYAGLVYINDFIFNGLVHNMIENFLIYGIGYGLIAAFGIRLKLFSKKEIKVLTAIFFVLFVTLYFVHNHAPTQQFKYPPMLYYMAYGLLVSLLLYQILQVKWIYRILNNKFVLFVSKTSLWLYFWHIIPIYFVKLFGNLIPIIDMNFITRFTFYFVAALLLTYIQELVNNKRMAIRKNKNLLKVG